ncbi:MAG: NADH-quinone oxidoreductase subunit N [Bacteroidetes bacterium]|nr:NADH-quinone oxidoreductase subunit N [Bacteroidota bacterium]MCL5026040.1 NADH-quinone oxidoreductase subunit N [Chloroflexota bacterium]
MTTADMTSLLPFIVMGATSIAVMLLIAVRRTHVAVLVTTLVGLAVTLIILPAVSSAGSRQVTPLLILDSYTFFYTGLIASASFAVALMAYPYFRDREGDHEEFYILLLLATLGSAVLVASNHFASFFLGLELLSVSLYTMLAYSHWRESSTEAGLKYLILAAASASFLLFGMALFYAELGTMELPAIIAALEGRVAYGGLLLTGVAMMTIGIGFKLAVVPFHMWTPDVYEGAPAPVTAFVATVSKGAMFALLLRYFIQIGVHTQASLFLMFGLIAVASMLAGNLLALLQNNVKRILAYSSIAHLGYLMVAFLASGPQAVAAVTFYLAAYFVTTLGAFGVVSLLSSGGKTEGWTNEYRDADALEDYRGLAAREPWLAGVFTAMLLSLAGIPLTAGFVGKFFVVAAGASAALWWLVIVLVVGSAIGLYYYLRVVVIMYAPFPVERRAITAPLSISLLGSVVLAVLAILLIWLGVYPSPLVSAIQAMVASLL